MSGVPFPSVAPGHPSGTSFAAGQSHNMYNHGSGGPSLSNNALMGPPHIGASDVTNMSPVEVYRQQHEVTATVCISSCLYSPIMCVVNAIGCYNCIPGYQSCRQYSVGKLV